MIRAVDDIFHTRAMPRLRVTPLIAAIFTLPPPLRPPLRHARHDARYAGYAMLMI